MKNSKIRTIILGAMVLLVGILFMPNFAYAPCPETGGTPPQCSPISGPCTCDGVWKLIQGEWVFFEWGTIMEWGWEDFGTIIQ